LLNFSQTKIYILCLLDNSGLFKKYFVIFLTIIYDFFQLRNDKKFDSHIARWCGR